MPRIPLAVNLESRNGSLSKDAQSRNCTIEVTDPKAGKKKLRKRPGCSDYGLVRVGLAQLLVYWNGIKSIIGDYFCATSGALSTNVTTWNPADKDGDVTLSGGNLTAAIAAPNVGMVRAVLPMTSGVIQWEITIGAGTSWYFGVANASESVANYPGSTNNSLGWSIPAGLIKNGVLISPVVSVIAGDVVGIIYDTEFRIIKFFKNGVIANQVSGADVPSGDLYAITGGNAVSGTITANFGATAFAYTYSNVQATNLSPTTASSLPFSAQDNGSNAATDYLMFKNANQAWTVTPSGSPSLITDVDYPGISTVNVTQITRSGTVVTVQTPTDTNFQVGSAVTIAGAVETDYNGVKTITSVTPSNIRAAVEIPITISRSGTTATATSTTQPHGFINGQVVPIKGADQAEYNGDKTITWISATQFSFTVTVTGTDASSPAGGSPVIDPYNLIFQATNTVGAPTVFACSYSKTVDYGSLVNGDTFTVNGLAMGVCTVSAAAAGTFTITSTGFGGATPGTFGLNALVTSPTISSITSSGSLATVTTSAAHNYKTGKQPSISGATPVVYNGLISGGIIVTDSTHFTYPLVGINSTPITPATGTILAGDPALITGASFTYSIATTPTTPATGTITASGGRNTVPGIVYINGYFCVMDVNGVLYNSQPDAPREWDALNFTTANAVTGGGAALGRTQDYVICFKEWSTEPFYDAKNPTGSPFSEVNNGFTSIGCASGTSLTSVDGSLVWVAQTRQQGRSVYTMTGTQQTKISTPSIDRILNADDLQDVYAYGLKLDGHLLYVLTLTTTGVTLVYDATSQHWYRWTSYTLGSSVGGTITITRSGTTATWTSTVAHGTSDGEPFLISGCTQTEYNGIWQISYISAYSFSFEVTGSPATPATGTPVGKPYTESYFKFTQYADCGGLNLMLHESDGHLYEIDPALAQDAGLPIGYGARSQRLDGNTSHRKTMGRITLIGDTVSDTAMVRWSDDDYATNRPYRIVDLDALQPMVRRCGAFHDRSIEVKHIGNTQPIWDEMELEIQ